MKKANVLISIVLVAIALCLTGCGPDGEPTVEEATLEVFIREMEEIKADCKSLPSDRAEFCIEVNDARIKLFQKYHDEADPKEAQAQMVAIGNEIQFEAKASTKWQFSIPSVPDVVCSVHANSSVTCVETDELLAPVDSETGQLILADIDGLYDFFGLEANADVLLDCGQGIWGADSFSAFGAADKAEFLSNSISSDPPFFPTKFIDLCYQSLLDNSSGGSGTGGGLFSGLTGFDPFGNVFCGAGDTGGAGTFENIIGTFESVLEDVAEGCDFSVDDMIASGDGEDDDETTEPDPEPTETQEPPPTEPPPEVTPEVEGPVFEEVLEDGSVKTTQRKYYADGTVVEVVVTTKNGKVTTRVITTTTPGGAWSRQTISYDENEQADWSYIYGYNSSSDFYWKSSKRNENGGWDKVLVTCGSRGCILDEWTSDVDGNDRWVRGSEANNMMCLETGGECGLCNAAMRTFVEALGKCSTPGGGSYGCGAYQKTWDCCSNIPGDPRVVVPNPQGDYVCSNDPASSEEEGSCEVMCSLASTPDGEDCLENCLSTANMRFWDVSLMDLICIYAISDACYQSYEFFASDYGDFDVGITFSVPDIVTEGFIIPFEEPQ